MDHGGMEAARVSYDCCLSHDWGIQLPSGAYDNHERVIRIGDALKDRGFEVWVDQERITGDIVCDGIDASDTVVVFVTRSYIDKVRGDKADDNCKLEFNYAHQRKTNAKMLAVVMEPECLDAKQWAGPVGMVLGGAIYIDFTRDSSFEANMTLLCLELSKRVDRLAVESVFTRVASQETFDRIYLAATDGDMENLTSLVEEWAGNPVLERMDPQEGKMPLHSACRGQLEAVLLLSKTPGVDINTATGEFGSTPLMVACHYAQPLIVAALLNMPNVDINKTGSQGGTALMCAVSPHVKDSRLEIVRLVLAQPGVNINAIATGGDWKGKTALMLATTVNTEDSAGVVADTAEDIAELQEVAKLLRVAGAVDIGKMVPGSRRRSVGH